MQSVISLGMNPMFLSTPSQSMLGTNQSALLTVPGQTQPVAGSQVLLMVPPPASQGFTQVGTSQLQTASFLVPGQQLKQQGLLNPARNQCLGSNSQALSSGQTAEKASNSISSTTKGEKSSPTLIYNLDTSTLPPEEQLKKFINSKTAPKDIAYYVVINKGQKTEVTFYIEPDKKGKSKPKQPEQTGTFNLLRSIFFLTLAKWGWFGPYHESPCQKIKKKIATTVSHEEVASYLHS